MLKLLLTDGKSFIPAFEHSPIQGLSVKTPIGTKIVIKNVIYSYGYIELRPECVYILGGKY